MKRAALGWAAGVTVAEKAVRKVVPSRSAAWIASYAGLALAAAIVPPGGPPRRGSGPGGWRPGVALALGGYPIGRRLLGDRSSGPPPDPPALELTALGVVVPCAEELVWGARVEPAWGVTATAAGFALKHVVVDGRWRRSLGLAAFWVGLGLVRRRSPRLAAGLHCACNAGAVLLGHATGRDQF